MPYMRTVYRLVVQHRIGKVQECNPAKLTGGPQEKQDDVLQRGTQTKKRKRKCEFYPAFLKVIATTQCY